MYVKAAYVSCLKKMPSIVDNFSVKRVCVDDFALRKRFSYGTVMVDLDTHRIIDLIPSRDTDDVRVWLKKFPNIEVVSRDGAQIYAHAVQKAHPEVVQVSDRFHLIKGLSEAVDKYIIRTFPAKLEIPAVTVQSPEIKQLLNINNRSKRIRFAHEQKEAGMTVYEIAVILHCTPKTVEKYLNTDPDTVVDRTISREKQHQLAIQQKQKDVDEARELAKNGIPIEHIAKMLHHTYRTIQRYLDPGYSVVNGHYNVRIPNKLAPFEEKVIMLRSQGMTYPKIHEIISKEGYNGSVASLRMFMQKEQLRRINEQEVNSDYQPVEFVQRKALTQLIYKSIDQVFTISKEQYNQVLKSYPLIAELYDVIQDFYRIINLKREDRLEEWLKKLEQFDIAELQTYVNGVRKDLDAVKNGIKYEYNNGLAEGSVNKIKVIKRTMYGRNRFQLLKAKVLLHEKFRFSIN